MTNDEIIQFGKDIISLAAKYGADNDDYSAALSIASALHHREWERRWKEEMARKNQPASSSGL